VNRKVSPGNRYWNEIGEGHHQNRDISFVFGLFNTLDFHSDCDVPSLMSISSPRFQFIPSVRAICSFWYDDPDRIFSPQRLNVDFLAYPNFFLDLREKFILFSESISGELPFVLLCEGNDHSSCKMSGKMERYLHFIPVVSNSSKVLVVLSDSSFRFHARKS
jgi:hypothetical protein